MADKIGVVLARQTWRVEVDERMGPENPCLWMQSGVTKFKNCTNEYDCITCKYDKAMGAKAAKGKQMTWQDSMRRLGDMDRTCRHTLTNKVGGRICAINYECSKCEFDQMFEDYMQGDEIL